MRRRIYLLRHAEVSYFLPDGTPLRPAEAPLTAEGRTQAEAARDALQGFGISHAVTSGLPRTVETARIVLTGRSVSVREERAFEEVSPGKIAEIPKEKAESVFTRAFDPADPAGARFLGGESFADFGARVLPAWTALLEEPSWETLLLVAHGGVNRVILAHCLGSDFHSFGHLEQDPACINILDVDTGRGSPRVLVRAVNVTPYNPLKRGLQETTMERLYKQYAKRWKEKG